MPVSEERRAQLRANLAKARETRAANAAARLAGSEQDAPADYAPTDKELGIGEETPEDKLALLLTDPRIEKLINAAVENRMKQLVGDHAAGANGGDQAALVSALVAALDRHSSAQAYQQPGHVKPLSAEEIDSRAQGYVEMGALIKRATETGERPTYLLLADFYCDEILFPQGVTIYWHGPPNTMMEPQNAIARQIITAMWQWIGDQTPIEDQVADAWAQRPKGENVNVPEPAMFREPRQSWQARVEQVPGVVRQQIGPHRIVGTVQPELPAGSISGPSRIPAAGAPRVGTVMPHEAPGPHQNF